MEFTQLRPSIRGRTSIPAAAFADVETQFLWYPYLPIGEYSVLIANGETRKTLYCGIAAAISTGKPLPGDGQKRDGKTVLILSAEDSGSILKQRLARSGADLQRVFLLDCFDSLGMNFSERYEEFQTAIQVEHPALVIVDPWYAFLGENVAIHRVNALRPVFQKLSHMAKQCDCTLLLVSPAANVLSELIHASRSALRVIRVIMLHMESPCATGFKKDELLGMAFPTSTERRSIQREVRCRLGINP